MCSHARSRERRVHGAARRLCGDRGAPCCDACGKHPGSTGRARNSVITHVFRTRCGDATHVCAPLPALVVQAHRWRKQSVLIDSMIRSALSDRAATRTSLSLDEILCHPSRRSRGSRLARPARADRGFVATCMKLGSGADSVTRRSRSRPAAPPPAYTLARPAPNCHESTPRALIRQQSNRYMAYTPSARARRACVCTRRNRIPPRGHHRRTRGATAWHGASSASRPRLESRLLRGAIQSAHRTSISNVAQTLVFVFYTAKMAARYGTSSHGSCALVTASSREAAAQSTKPCSRVGGTLTSTKQCRL